MGIPRFIKSAFIGYRILDFKEFLSDGYIVVWLEKDPEQAAWLCHRCGEGLKAKRGKYPVCLEGLPIMEFKFLVHLWREKGDCPNCKKARSEYIEFIADETPHLTQDYAYWLGKMCEFAPTSRVAEFVEQDETTIWRLDLERMKRMLAAYKIPPVLRIAVDEVYARRKKYSAEENRNQRFFTVITDLNTHKVIWVTDGRDADSLEQFFVLLGKKACKKIEVVAADMHEEYAKAVAKHCPGATLVWDRFHVMQNFEKYVNDTRKALHEALRKNAAIKEKTRGQYRFVFLKKASRRTEAEQKHVDAVLKDNEQFMRLELIKERMITFFDQPDEYQARMVFHEVGTWIIEAGFEELKTWWWRMNNKWDQLANYFKHRVTSSVSEGINNVIKALKRRSFGFRNMEYFKLKIMQVCGYLNSRFIPQANQAHAQI